MPQQSGKVPATRRNGREDVAARSAPKRSFVRRLGDGWTMKTRLNFIGRAAIAALIVAASGACQPAPRSAGPAAIPSTVQGTAARLAPPPSADDEIRWL